MLSVADERRRRRRDIKASAGGKRKISPGSFRSDIVQLHRRIFRRNREILNRAVVGYTKEFRTYEARYGRGVRGYLRRAKLEHLDRALDRTRIAFIGDYHTLKQAQRSYLRLLRRLPKQRKVVLALEFVQGRYQAAIDEYLLAGMDDSAAEARFLDAIDHQRHWVFGCWPHFKPIFDFARKHGHPIIGIDTQSRGGAATSLAKRDRYAARQIARALRQHPEHLLMVLIGELHIAPEHLPAAVSEAHTEHGGTALAPVLIYQNCEELYWQLEESGHEHDTELVHIAPRRYCLMNTPPIVCQQSFLNWLNHDDEALEAPETNFREQLQSITSFFDLHIGQAIDDVEIATVVDLSFLQRLKRRGDFSKDDMRHIHRQILASESYYIPRARMVYLGNLSVNHAAEEATHFIRHVLTDSHEPRLLVDAFYWRVLEEAVGFLGSKVVNHKRKAPDLQAFRRIGRSKRSSAAQKKTARLVLKHHRMHSGQRVRQADDIYGCAATTFNEVTHAIGYLLGERIYYGLVRGDLDRNSVRSLFLDPFDGEGGALTTYLFWRHKTQDVILPHRL